MRVIREMPVPFDIIAKSHFGHSAFRSHAAEAAAKFVEWMNHMSQGRPGQSESSSSLVETGLCVCLLLNGHLHDGDNTVYICHKTHVDAYR